jgi:hypothetical protein
MTAYTEFVKEWAKRNGVSYMCAIGKPGLKTEYNNSKNIVNKKGRAIQAVNSYNEQGGFRPRAKRTRKPKTNQPNQIELGLATILKKKENTKQIKKKRLVLDDLPPNWIQQRSGDGRRVFFNTMTGRSQFEIPS